MRVLVTGGRDYINTYELFGKLNELHNEVGITVVIHGGASGADALAGNWARSRKVQEIACPADWDKHGKAAGPIRNQEMLEQHKPDLVVAFSGGRGTADMVRRARDAGVRVVEAR